MTKEIVVFFTELLGIVVLALLLMRLLRRKSADIVFVGLILGSSAFLVALTFVVYLGREAPPITAIQAQYLLKAALFDQPSIERKFIPLDRMSPNIVQAVIVGEDPRFMYHGGVDWYSVRVKTAAALRDRTRFVGASSITQQLATNLFLCRCRLYSRKAIELPLTILLEAILPKSRILELYLNVVEWGDGIYGIEAAAQHYYGVTAADLSSDQSARLVAILPNPRVRHPSTQDSTRAVILKRMDASRL